MVLPQAEQDREPELAEALLDREAVDQLEAALGEADHRLALQNNGRTVARQFPARCFPFIVGRARADPAR